MMGHNKKGVSMKRALAFIMLVCTAAVLMIGSAGIVQHEQRPTVVKIYVPVEQKADTLIGASNVWKLNIADLGWGTAFPVACEPSGGFWKVTFLTAKHCTIAPGTILSSGALPWYNVHHDDKRALSCGRLLSIHPKEDAALLVFISTEPVDCRMLNFTPPVFGERLFLAGYPMGEGPYLTEGRASGGRRFSASGFPGSSGGPVTRADGAVCAIIVAGHGTQFQFVDFMLYHVPLNSIERWLRLYI